MHAQLRPGFKRLVVISLFALLPACASLPNYEPPRVSVAGIEHLKGEGSELRFNIKLRIQNPNRSEISYQGILVDLLVDGRRIATGISSEPGLVPAYGETVYSLPVTVSTLNVLRQIIAIAEQPQTSSLRYEIKGKLDGGLFGTVRFSDNGSLKLPE